MERNEGCSKCRFSKISYHSDPMGLSFGHMYCGENPKLTETYDHILGSGSCYDYAECGKKNKNGKCKLFERKLSFFERIFC
jgi:hypothetical protein